MDEVIKRAIDSVNKVFESLPSFELDSTRFRLLETRDLLNCLLETDSINNESTRLFCRRLKRLMDYNESLSQGFWIELYDDIFHILKKSNSDEHIVNDRERINEMMRFEKVLEERELNTEQALGLRKNLKQFLHENQTFFIKYLQKCVSLHSRIQVQGLVDSIGDSFFKTYSITSEIRHNLNEKLKYVTIDFDCSDKLLKPLKTPLTTDDSTYNRVGTSLAAFLPSVKGTGVVSKDYQVETITNVLEYNRWIVILGDPGSSKTTLLRWITRLFAEFALHGRELPIRIPILIRIGEFATWLEKHQDKTLMDYIGGHTWFSEHYHDDNEAVLKDLIRQGHALILLDGLDEITEVERRGEIVQLVRNFISEHVHSANFFSAFDNRMFNKRPSYEAKIIEVRSPGESGGNQIIVTSREVGYQLYPLVGPFIKHYSLSLMNYQQANAFIREWMSQIGEQVKYILSNEGIKLHEKDMQSFFDVRWKAMQSILKNYSQVLMESPSLLSMICTFVFQSPDRFHPKSPIEVYDHTIQISLRRWRNQQLNMSETVLIEFLIALAGYLHLNSSSGLIDEFDMTSLCRLVLKQQGVSHDRKTLNEQAKNFISSLEQGVGIFAERGLQIFGFLHLSFQEYFIAQYLVKGSADEIAQRILSIIIHPRFRQSICLAISWISWKWPPNDYNKVLSLLVNPTKGYSIPFGTLLLFEVLGDMQSLPSDSIIFTALNNIADHPSNTIRNTYLIPSLLKLDRKMIIDYMRSHLQDEERLANFCQSLMDSTSKFDKKHLPDGKQIKSIIYQQLWSFREINPSFEFIIDQIFRRTVNLHQLSNRCFRKTLQSCLRSNHISESDIHPLILSVIIALYGGIYFQDDSGTLKVAFSTQQMHCESLLIAPLIDYFDNSEESHAVKTQKLIEQYKNNIEKSLPSDLSNDTIDSFVALICLQGVSQPSIYATYDGYLALTVAIDRLKRTWFYFGKKLHTFTDDDIGCNDTSVVKSEIESIMNVLVSQHGQSDEQRTALSVACASAWEKLELWDITNILNKDDDDDDDEYFSHQPKFIHLFSDEKLFDIIVNINSQEKSPWLLNFLPKSLQALYRHTIITSTSLPFVVFLSQCLVHLDDVDKNNLNFGLTLPVLYILMEEHMLENYALIHFRTNCYPVQRKNKNYKKLFQVMEDCNLLDPFLLDQPLNYEGLIDEERQRIFQAKGTAQNQITDEQLFAASISLARLFQAQHRLNDSYPTKTSHISDVNNNEVYSTISSIIDPVLRIMALSIILNMKDPLIFEIEARNKLLWEMTILLKYLLPSLPLPTAVVLFIQCYPTNRLFHIEYQEMSNVIAEKFNDYANDEQSQEVAFIALQSLNDPQLSSCLSQFIKRTNNIYDLLQFHSSMFHNFFTNTNSFESLNITLLASMYLTELCFDNQILTMHIKNNGTNKLSLLDELDLLWNETSKVKKLLTSRVASWITDHLYMLNKLELSQVIQDVSQCLMIDKAGPLEVCKWLNYRTCEGFRFFAHYAALQLIIEGSDIADETEIIDEMLIVDTEFILKPIIEHLISSRLMNSTAVRHLLFALHKNANYCSKIYISIYSEDMLQLCLELEIERIKENVPRSFFSIVNDCSQELQSYLVKHLCTCIIDQIQLENFVKENYLIVIVQWMLMKCTRKATTDNFAVNLYKSILQFFDYHGRSAVQKAIVYVVNSIYIDIRSQAERISMQCARGPQMAKKLARLKESLTLQSDTITCLENVISSRNLYSDDVLVVSLLAYGNYLLVLDNLNMEKNVSDELRNALTILSAEASYSNLIAIRAAFCLNFIEYSNITHNTISSWYKHKSDLTAEMKYKILLQQTLYNTKIGFGLMFDNEVIDHLHKYSSDLMNTFINDLFNYLRSTANCNYLYEPAPDYIKIALAISRRKLNEFRDAVRQGKHGEIEFKRELYRCCMNNQNDNKSLVELYAMFAVFTMELVGMLKLLGYASFDNNESFMTLLKVFDRDIIDHVFDLCNTETYAQIANYVLPILEYFVKIQVVSFLEVHERVLTGKYLVNNFKQERGGNQVFHLLLKVSCFAKDFVETPERMLLFERDIEQEFKKVYKDSKRNDTILIF
ncbi:unnamed protein product [Adineta ricciae]|uniref:NACHT domain-containing protein n=1 Tax=Adineta ricciae TaxID=249248 RepID=A0A814YMP6_ADIRI|nr:unnamed protein product [Adineta ricciae]